MHKGPLRKRPWTTSRSNKSEQRSDIHTTDNPPLRRVALFHWCTCGLQQVGVRWREMLSRSLWQARNGPRHPEGRACVQARPFCFDREWLPGFLRGSNLQKACKRVLGDRWYPRLRRRMQREAQNRTSRRSLMSPVTQDIGRPSAGATKCRSGSSAGNGARMPRRS